MRKLSAQFVSSGLGSTSYIIYKGIDSARVEVEWNTGNVSYPYNDNDISVYDAIKAIKRFKRARMRKFIREIKNNRWARQHWEQTLKDAFIKRNKLQPAPPPAGSKDVTDYAHALGYEKISDRVIVLDAKVVSHGYMDWFIFCNKCKFGHYK